VRRMDPARIWKCGVRQITAIAAALLAMTVLQPVRVEATVMNVGDARKLVKNWLQANPQPLGARLGKTVGKVDRFTDDAGQVLYYAVYLEPSGFVIVPAEDLVEPVIAFAEMGSYKASDDNPLGALVTRDVPARVKAARRVKQQMDESSKATAKNGRQSAFSQACVKARGKWDRLSSEGQTISTQGIGSISEVRVAPLLESTWGQTTVGDYIGGITCYNYYTPSNYPCGCVATAMAQLMRFHEHPVAGIGRLPFSIKVDGVWQTAYTRGGNGSGGPYSWTDMVLEPDFDISLVQRQAIGALCHDAGVSIETYYTAAGSSAAFHDASHALTDTFLYSNSIHGYSISGQIGSALTNMVNPNLDAAHPVMFGIDGPYGGHAVICDGYGLNSATIYHHLNMGWSGRDNAWYDVPTVQCPETGYQADSLHTCIYNVFASGSGEIISGRILDPGGNPISGATVTAVGGGTYYATSNDRGIYAVAKVPSARSFTVSVSKGKWDFSSRIVGTGTSLQDVVTCGNVWEVDFTGNISAGYIELDRDNYTAGETITIKVVDTDLLGNGSESVNVTTTGGDLETVALTESPASSGVFEGSIATAQETVVTADGTVQVGHGDVITATYEDADNGTGSPSVSQDTATVTGSAQIVYEADFTTGLPAGWTIVDGGTSSDTWAPDSRPGSYWDGTFMIADSEDVYGEDMDEQLITHEIDCSYYLNVRLKFSHYFKWYWDGPAEIGDVDVRVNGGLWQNVARYTGSDCYGQVELDLSGYADGEANVQIRWRYYNANWDYYWGIDNVQIMATELPHPPIAIRQTCSAQTGLAKDIFLEACDDGSPGPVSYVVCSLAKRGTLTDEFGHTITAGDLPYALPSDSNKVTYASRQCYTGSDSFTFKADDGGTPPNGGESNTATVSIEVAEPVIYETDFEEGLDPDWTIVDGYSDGATWFWAESTTDGRKLMVVDSDGAGYVWMDEQLVTGSIDCSDYATVILVFEHLFIYNSVEIADVDIRIGAGLWQNVARYQGVDVDEITYLDISSMAAGQSDVHIRWHYYNAYYDWYWVLYEVRLLGGLPGITGDLQGDCVVNFSDFAAFALAWHSSQGNANWNPACDISDPADSHVDENDLGVLSENWLLSMNP